MFKSEHPYPITPYVHTSLGLVQVLAYLWLKEA